MGTSKASDPLNFNRQLILRRSMLHAAHKSSAHWKATPGPAHLEKKRRRAPVMGWLSASDSKFDTHHDDRPWCESIGSSESVTPKLAS